MRARQQQSLGSLVIVDPQRNGVKGTVERRMKGDSPAVEVGRLAAGESLDQGMTFILTAESEICDRGGRDPVLCHQQDLAREQVGDGNDRLLDIGVRHEPVDRTAR